MVGHWDQKLDLHSHLMVKWGEARIRLNEGRSSMARGFHCSLEGPGLKAEGVATRNVI